MGRLGISIVNYNSAHSTRELITDIARDPWSEFIHICIVDNSEDDAELSQLDSEAQIVRESFASIDVVQAPSNIGYAGGNNLAIEFLIANHGIDAFFIVNPDVRIRSSEFSSAASKISDSPNCIFVVRSKSKDGLHSGVAAMRVVTGRTVQLREADQQRAGWIHYPAGHFIGMSTQSYEDIGRLSQDYFLYSEELDLAIRGERHNFSICQLPGFLVDHESGGSTGSSGSRKSLVTLHHAGRSRVILYRKHRRLRPFLPTMLLARVLWLPAIFRQRGIRGVIAAMRGLYAGLCAPLSRRD